MTYRGAVLDLDGTVYRGPNALPGVPTAIESLRERGLSVCFFSNNPTKDGAAYVERLAGMGIDATASEVLSAGTVTTDYLVSEHPDDRLFVVGSSGLRAQFDAADLTVTRDPRDAEVVVGSFYRGFDYDTLTESYYALRDGAPFIATDPDLLVPVDGGLVPGSGAILKSMAGIAGREPDRVMGKPSAEAQAAAIETLDCRPEECLVVGDRLDTDIALGERAGMTTVLVRSGVTDEATLAASPHEPDFVVDSLVDVPALL
jgi:4-nitrophenyl phosphatase